MDAPQQPIAQVGRRRLLKAAVYTTLVLLSILLALTARGFSRDVGDARVSGRFSLLPVLQSRRPVQLALTWNGLTLHFSRDGSPSLRGFESAGDATDIVFDDGRRLRLVPGADAGGSLSLAPVSGADGGATPAGSSVVVGFTLQGVLQDPAPDGAALGWRHAGRTFVLSLPAGGESNPQAGTLTIPLSGATVALLKPQGIPAVAGTAAAAPVAAAAARLPREEDMPGADRLKAVTAAFLESAWQGWSSTRYSAADSSWRLADGTRGFSEDIGVALLSQSVARGSFPATFGLWSDALAIQEKKAAPLSRVTSAYVGGERDFASSLQRSADAEVSRAANLLQQNDVSLLRVTGLVPLLLDHGTADLMQKAGAFLAGHSAAGLDAVTALGFAGNLLDYYTLMGSDEHIVQLLKDTVTKDLLPAVRAADAGVFLDTGKGSSDVATDIRAGALLLRAASVIDSSLAAAVGRGLIVSSLSLGNEAGFLPAVITLDAGHITRRDGAVAPETIYPDLPGTAFVPREIPLASAAGKGAWVWTCASLASVTGTPAELTLAFAYPRGVPYHLVLHGVRPFSLLKLHGIPWHADPTYFKYSDGWTYDGGSQTLFMKITGRLDQEEIDITW